MQHIRPPYHHQHLELAQTHVHWVSDAIQPSHPLSSLSPPAFNLSQHQGLFQRVSSSHERAKVWSFSFSISPSNEYSGVIFFRIDWFDLLAVQGTLKSLFQHHSSKASVLQCSTFFMVKHFPHSSVGKQSACNAGDPDSIPGLGRSSGEGIGYPLQYFWASLVAQLVKNPPAIWKTWVRSLGWEDPLEKGKAIHSSILAWRIPWTIVHGVTKSWTRLSDFHFHSHPYMTIAKTTALTIWTSVGKVMPLILNMLSRLVIAFLPKSKHLLISWLQSPSAVILEPKKIVCHCFHCFPIYLPWSDRIACHDLSFLNVEFKASFFPLLFYFHQEVL